MPSTQSSSRNQTPTGESNGEWLQTRPGERCLIRVSAADTNGAYSVVEIVAEPGDSTPIHVHQNEDEHFLILEGAARIAYGDKTFDAAAGEISSLSKGVPHAWGNASASPLRMLVMVSPGGCEEALRIIAKGVTSTWRPFRRSSMFALSDHHCCRGRSGAGPARFPYS
jgi:quercetin dioxygenase-like cupin family protein